MMNYLKSISVALLLFACQSILAKTGLFFDVSATGTPAQVNITLCLNAPGPLTCQNYNVSALTLSIRTVTPHHTYPSAGIKINTPGYIPQGCTPISNGFCVFSVSDTMPATISLNSNATINYTIGGSITGLTANGLVLQNNGANNLPVAPGATAFQFATPVASGGSYNVTILQQPIGLTCTVSNGSGSNVMSNVTSISIVCSAGAFTIGGSLTGLTANGLVLQNNGADNLPVASGATSFQFATPVASGGSYNVTILQQPTGLTCTVSNGSGTNVMSNVTNISIICSAGTFTIGGSLTGLTANGLILQNNGADNLPVASGATSFQFATPVASGGSYNVTILQQPTGLTCTVSNGSGTNVMSNVTNVNIACSATTFTIGGSITGLTANGLILQNNGGDNLTVTSGSTSFQFATPVPFGGSYNVTVLQQPTGLTCTVGNGSGTNVMNNVTNISIMCSSVTFTIGGTISGLTASGLVLQNNGGDNLPVASGDTTFQFVTPVAFGGSYNVTVFQQPTGLTCTVTNGSGTNVMSNVTNVSVTCSQQTYTIGGVVLGVHNGGLIIQNNGGDNLSIDGTTTLFQFPTPVASGGSYNVTVFQQPAQSICTVNNGSGSNVMANVTNVLLICDIRTFTIGGTITGLTASGLVLQNNGGDNLIVPSGATSFQFNTPVAYGGNYNVTVQQQPVGLTCTVNNGTGTNVTSNVTNISVTCSPSVYTIGGTITGLTSNGLVLQNNGADNLTLNAGATSFQFSTPVAYQGSYNVTILQKPTGLNCTVTNGSGTNVMSDVTNVNVSCYSYLYATLGSTTNQTLVCQVNNSTGTVSNCVQGDTSILAPYGIALNPANTLVYIASQFTNTINICHPLSTGLLTNCADSGATGITTPVGVAFTPSGSFFYVATSTGVSRCIVNSTTGALSSCIDSGATNITGPFGITVNAAGTFAYITNSSSTTVTQCTINSTTGLLSGCTNSGATLIDSPRGVVFNSAGTFGYISSTNETSATRCAYNGVSGSFSSCVNTGTLVQGSSLGIVLNSTGQYIYIANNSVSTLVRCSVNSVDGSLSGCTNASSIVAPVGLAFYYP